VIGAVIALSLLWTASEFHYRNCIQAAEARTGPARTDVRSRLFGEGSEREKALDGCSRLPF
jgi:hypothetical protein